MEGKLAAALFALSFAAASAATAAPKPKALVVMLDGTRSDAIENGETPNMKRLVAGTWQKGYACAWTPAAKTIHDALASSAPNHAAIALGVTAGKSGVLNNGYYKKCDYAKWPSWLARIAEARPDARTLFMYSWKADEGLCPDPRVEFLFAGSLLEGAGHMSMSGAFAYQRDFANGEELARRLSSPAAPDATLLFLDLPDFGGHGHLHGDGTGFYPYCTTYLGAVHAVDAIIGKCLDAIAARPGFKDEDWLVMITSDHGGYAKTHGLFGGHATAIPLIVSSRRVRQGRIPGTPHNYDVAPTVLDHFGIDWSGFGLDGQVVGREEPRRETPRRLDDGLAAYLSFDGREIRNAAESGVVPEICGGATKVEPGAGFFHGALRFCGETDRTGGVRLKGTETLAFENGADFSATLWVRLDRPQKGDTLLFGNKNWSSGNNPGVALCASKTTQDVKTPGVVFNCIGVGDRAQSNGKVRRIDVGTYDVEYGKWTFYAVSRGSDGVLRLYQGAHDGRLYCICEDTSELELATGLPFFLGQDGTGRYGKTLEGRIDEFALWARELSHGDIRKIYESGRKGLPLGNLLANGK